MFADNPGLVLSRPSRQELFVEDFSDCKFFVSSPQTNTRKPPYIGVCSFIAGKTAAHGTKFGYLGYRRLTSSLS